MKIRIALAVDQDGNWNVCGWGGPDNHPTDTDVMGSACDTVGDGERRYWIEVEVPDPREAILPATITPSR